MDKNNLVNAAGAGMDDLDTLTRGKAAGKRGKKQTRTDRGYRFCLNMPPEYEAYLKEAAYNASSPGKVVTITDYLNDLIKKDMVETYKKNLEHGEKDDGKK